MKILSFLPLTVAATLFMSGCVTKNLNMDQVRQDSEQTRAQNLEQDRAVIEQQAWHAELQQELTLEKMMQLARSHNLEYMVKELEAAQADDELAAAKLALLPRAPVGANGGYSTSEGYVFSKNQATGTKSATASTSQRKFKGGLNLSLQWSVLDFGISYYRAKQKIFARQIVDERKRRALSKLALNLVQDYMRLSVAKVGLQQAKKALLSLNDATMRMKKLAESGDIDKYEVLQYESKRVALENARETLQAEANAATMRLAQTIGVPPGMRFKVKMPNFDPEVMPKQFDVLALVDQALRSRPELFEADLKEKITRKEVEVLALERWPNLSGVLGGTYDSNTFLDQSIWATVGLDLSWDLLSFPRLTKQKEAMEKRAEVLVKERHLLAMGVMAETHLAYGDYKLKAQRYQRMKRELELHRALLGLAQKRAKAGKLSNIDLIAHEAAAVEKSIQVARSYADWMEALQGVYYAAQQEDVTAAMDGNKETMPQLAALSYANNGSDSLGLLTKAIPTVRTVALHPAPQIKTTSTPIKSKLNNAVRAGIVYRVLLPKPHELSRGFVTKQLTWLKRNGYPDAYLKRNKAQDIVLAAFSKRQSAERMVRHLRKYNLVAKVERAKIY
ncbi:MAG: TolC family protein [Mariprofundales bacterium]